MIICVYWVAGFIAMGGAAVIYGYQKTIDPNFDGDACMPLFGIGAVFWPITIVICLGWLWVKRLSVIGEKIASRRMTTVKADIKPDIDGSIGHSSAATESQSKDKK